MDSSLYCGMQQRRFTAYALPRYNSALLFYLCYHSGHAVCLTYLTLDIRSLLYVALDDYRDVVMVTLFWRFY